jgi:hypothetical protein
MVVDAYDFTEKLFELIVKEDRLMKVSKDLIKIKDNAAKVRFLERLLLEKKLMPNQAENMRKEKSNQLAKQYRDQGNKHYSNRQFFDALECYNQSLCFAEKDSENVGLAYASKYDARHNYERNCN